MFVSVGHGNMFVSVGPGIAVVPVSSFVSATVCPANTFCLSVVTGNVSFVFPFYPPPSTPISLMVSVDIKHHVYLLTGNGKSHES